MERLDPTPLDLDRIEALADLPALRHELQAAVAALPLSQAEAIGLRIVEQLPYPEVAERLGCSEGAARVRVSRGLSRLADTLED